MRWSQFFRSVVRNFGFEIVRADHWSRLVLEHPQSGVSEHDGPFLYALRSHPALGSILQNFHLSRAQLRQDLFALACLGFPRAGFFVEFGAADGLRNSNTYLLESQFDWAGILVEPAVGWHSRLRDTREAILDYRLVWESSGDEVEFVEAEDPELSTASQNVKSDGRGALRKTGYRYPVSTVSLKDLLDEHNAPQKIDYLSVDTEGSEKKILGAFDFAAYSFKVITVEHNFSRQRDGIRRILTSHGYQQVLEQVSVFDDWFVHESMIGGLKGLI